MPAAAAVRPNTPNGVIFTTKEVTFCSVLEITPKTSSTPSFFGTAIKAKPNKMLKSTTAGIALVASASKGFDGTNISTSETSGASSTMPGLKKLAASRFGKLLAIMTTTVRPMPQNSSNSAPARFANNQARS